MTSIIFQFTSLQISIIILCFSLLQFIFINWIKAQIKHEFDKKLEEYKFLQMQRQKAEIIAKFFAKWIKYRGQEQSLLDKKELINYYEDLNQMSFEISIWISDDNLLKEVMKRFNNHPEAKDIRGLIGKFRELILDVKKDTFKVEEIILWPTDEIAEEIGLIKINK